MAQSVWRPVPGRTTAAGIAASSCAAFFGGAPGARRTARRGLLARCFRLKQMEPAYLRESYGQGICGPLVS